MDKLDISHGRHAFLLAHDAYNGDKMHLATCQKLYRKLYNKAALKKHRLSHQSITISVEPKVYQMLEERATFHSATVSQYVYLASIAYSHQQYLVPDQQLLTRLLQTLSKTASEIRNISISKELPYHFQFNALAQRVNELEDAVKTALTSPPCR